MSVPTSATERTMRTRFGSWLKARREDAELTQLEVATRLGYGHSQTVSQIERGASWIPVMEIARWAEAIRIPPARLAETFLYYSKPELYAVLYGKDPYAIEQLPRPDPTITRGQPRARAGTSEAPERTPSH